MPDREFETTGDDMPAVGQPQPLQDKPPANKSDPPPPPVDPD